MVRLNRIYTGTGDDGSSGLVDGSRLSKADALFAAIGDVDELNSAIGVARAQMGGQHPALTRIQNDLFDLGADIATPADAADGFAPSEMVLRIVPAQAEWLEQAIDRLTANLEPLRSFILPGGSMAAAHVHLARAIARRAERSLVAAAAGRRINPAALVYLNRLSDYLFVLARTENDGGRADALWVPGASRG